MTVYHGWAGNVFHPPCLTLPASPAEPLSRQASILEDCLDQQPSVLLNTTAVRHLQHHVDSVKRLEIVLQGGTDTGLPQDTHLASRVSSSSAHPGSFNAAALSALRAAYNAENGPASFVTGQGAYGCPPAFPAALLRPDRLERQLRYDGGPQPAGANSGGEP